MSQRRTITQTLIVPARDERTADRQVQDYLKSCAPALADLGIRAFPAVVADPADDGEQVLTQILRDVLVADEVQSADGACLPGYVPAEDSDLFDQLFAWRDRAVREALAAAEARAALAA